MTNRKTRCGVELKSVPLREAPIRKLICNSNFTINLLELFNLLLAGKEEKVEEVVKEDGCSIYSRFPEKNKNKVIVVSFNSKVFVDYIAKLLKDEEGLNLKEDLGINVLVSVDSSSIDYIYRSCSTGKYIILKKAREEGEVVEQEEVEDLEKRPLFYSDRVFSTTTLPLNASYSTCHPQIVLFPYNNEESSFSSVTIEKEIFLSITKSIISSLRTKLVKLMVKSEKSVLESLCFKQIKEFVACGAIKRSSFIHLKEGNKFDFITLGNLKNIFIVFEPTIEFEFHNFTEGSKWTNLSCYVRYSLEIFDENSFVFVKENL